jgi:hypothetical protein
MSALTTLETDLDCGERKKEEKRIIRQYFCRFQTERERERAAEQISAVATKCYILLLFPSFFVWVVWFFFFLSLSFKKREKKRSPHTTHTKKKERKERDDGSAFFPLEKYLPLVSRKIKDKTKSD